MTRLALCLGFFLFFLSARATSPVLTVAANEQIPSPAPVGATEPAFCRDANGALILCWKESAESAGSAVLNPADKTWIQAAARVSDTGKALRRIEADGRVVVSESGRQAKAWIEDSSDGRRVQLSLSPDAGAHFLLPLRIDDGHPCGAPDLLLLPDGTVFAAWPEHGDSGDETRLWLRRISPGGSLSVPVLLGSCTAPSPDVRIALVNRPETGPVRLLVAYVNGAGDSATIVTRLLAVDPATNTPRKNPCNCPDDDETAAGYALRGIITALAPDHSTVSIRHNEIPDVLPEGVTEFKVEPSFFAEAKAGGEVLARTEKRGPDWWLLSPRLLVHPQK